MNATVAAAIIAGGISLVVAVFGNVAGYFLQRAKLRQELRTEFMAEQAIMQLLSHSSWNQRSFETISRYVGGFPPDELRRLLVRAGALRFQPNEQDVEYWGLRTRNTHLLE